MVKQCKQNIKISYIMGRSEYSPTVALNLVLKYIPSVEKKIKLYA